MLRSDTYSKSEVVEMALPSATTILMFRTVAWDHWVPTPSATDDVDGDAVPLMVMGLFFGMIQAFVFIMLATIYISGAVAHEH